MSQSSLKRTPKPGTLRFSLQSSSPKSWILVPRKKQSAARRPKASRVNSIFPWWITTSCRHKGRQRDKWHINKSFTGWGRGGMESDVSFPRNPFITITRSQVLGLLFQLQNLAYNYVLHHTVGQGPPEQTGNKQSKPSGPKSPPPPFAEQRGSLGCRRWNTTFWNVPLCYIGPAILIQIRGTGERVWAGRCKLISWQEKSLVPFLVTKDGASVIQETKSSI